SVFGPTRMTTEQLTVLDALAAHREVHLWLPHPSRALWERVVERQVGLTARRGDPTADLPVHPLLRSCARDARELQLRLPAGETTHDAGEVPADTVLGRLQQDIREDRAPRPAAASDRS